ncbi:cob(I)yrinic acid a,c-diamide adenosyltransferase [Carboxylicivirga caseinilyticus]|uniref:cob(I)yrinic acid a,c-diamide adenosyltransferase n=1 Tax=Carboxylicivirga caseinilyticus TaxID=3417572 RepID=UPI002AA6BCD0|nr:cob(I)yrinic acid a,c-diamide adenosyltransferase [uncultured Carboxylicivirga sp.]MCU4166097.1 cob(I)yrinic acid a,c-diamide adenosyltransferase [Marinilabiliaceae bacterium A049]
MTKGLTIVITGNGKGKTTSALGMLMRTLGHDKKACVIQFMKSPESGYGEINMMNRLGVENYQAGAGCTWTVSKEDTVETVQSAWELAKHKVMADGYDFILLDEINIALSLPEKFEETLITADELIELIRQMRSRFPERHLVLTGRYALPEIIAEADLVSEINNVKHPYKNGVMAQECIEF